MPEALKCPTCAAPLDYPTDGATTIRCPYCQSTVILPGPDSSASPEGHVADAIRPMVGNALEMAKIVEMLRSGNKIDAIKIYRTVHGVDLLTAKSAVENLAAGRAIALGTTTSPNFDSSVALKLASSGTKLGCALIALIIPLVACFMIFMFHFTHHKITSAVSSRTQSPPVSFAMPFATPDAPTFAHVVQEFGSKGIGAARFKDSRSIAIDGAGHIYVGEYSDGRVQVFDSQGKFLKEWSIGRNKSLLNLAANRQGTVFAVIPAHILCYEGVTGLAMGEAQTTYGDTQEYYSDAVAALSGDIYAIAGAADIVILDSDGKIKSVINAGEKVGEDVSFFRIAVVPTGEIYAMDRTRGVFKFAPDGRYINRFGGGEGAGPGHLTSPNNLAIDGNGRIYVTDIGPAVQVFDSDGRYVDSFGGRDVAFGIAINDQNEILACYRNKYQIRRFALDKSPTSP